MDCTWRCRVNSFADVSFIMAIRGEKALWSRGGSYWPGNNWKQCRAALHHADLLYICDWSATHISPHCSARCQCTLRTHKNVPNTLKMWSRFSSPDVPIRGANMLFRRADALDYRKVLCADKVTHVNLQWCFQCVDLENNGSGQRQCQSSDEVTQGPCSTSLPIYFIWMSSLKFFHYRVA